MKGKTLYTMALVTAMVMVCAAFGGCAGIQTQHQKIAAACESAATAADVIAVGTTGGRISTAQAQTALEVYRITVPFCEPEPVASLNSADYAALITAAAQLSILSEKAK